MKKLLFVCMAAFLIASPVMAAEIKATDEGAGIVRIDYIRAASEQRIRAFGLDLTISGGNATPDVTTPIVAGSYKTGESTSASKGFGIFPGSIVIAGDGSVTGYGTPKAAVGSAGALTAPGLTLELGSLFTGDGNSPAPGTAAATIQLCKVKYTGTTTSTLTLAANATRGGVVFEDGTAASPTFTGTTIVFEAAPAAPTGVAASDGIAITTDATLITKIRVTWTASAGATSYDVYRNTSNTSGTATLLGNIAASPYLDTTAPSTNVNYYYWVKAKNAAGASDFSNSDTGYRVATLSGTELTAGMVFANAAGTTTTITATMVTDWTNMGKPKAWTCNAHYLGNAVTFGGSASRPDGTDLAAVKAAWFIQKNAIGYIPGADLNNSGRADGTDLAWVKAKWFVSTGNTGCN